MQRALHDRAHPALGEQPLVVSARNVLRAVVQRVWIHGEDAEVLLEVDQTRWLVAIVPEAVEALGLTAGQAIWMMIKARSCHLLDEFTPP